MEQEHIEVAAPAPRATAALRGEFDMAATFTVEPVLERCSTSPGVERLRVDLAAVSFIDSTGIGVLVRITDEARGAASS